LTSVLIDIRVYLVGRNSSNFTSTSRLFIENPSVELWRFEVTYRFVSANSSSSLNFVINRSPYNGSCSINPLNGTTSTVFTVSCPDWFDEDEIKDYSIQGNYHISHRLISLLSFQPGPTMNQRNSD
jgi:hypothetical protein